MTRKEAIDILQNTSFFGRTTDDFDNALDIAIKALEQEHILDKIRAEIEHKAHSGQWSDATMCGMLKAVAIIDKYKRESEE